MERQGLKDITKTSQLDANDSTLSLPNVSRSMPHASTFFWLLPRKTYNTAMSGPGLIRPWQCAWRGDFGVSSMVDPDQAEMLMEVIVQEGFLGAFSCLLRG